MNSKIKKLIVKKNYPVKEIMRRMDTNKEKIIFVVDANNRLLGSVTDGDIRRWILANGSLRAKVSNVYNRNPKTVEKPYDLRYVKELMLRTKIEWIPVVSEDKQVITILIRDDVFKEKKHKAKRYLNIPAVIMAGGSGTRLDPFTKILPKPLIPIKGRPFIEIVMEKFNQYGIRKFFITLNYKSRIIRAYFEEARISHKIRYITENKPLGTAGSLRYLIGKVSGPIIVTNCDILINCDYKDITDFHKKNKNDITIVGSFRNFVIPYGICEINNGGILKNIKEKPKYDFLINTGMYVLSSKVLKLIPHGKVFHMTDLIKKVKNNKGKISVFPISENSWIDVGQWQEYQRSLKQLETYK